MTHCETLAETETRPSPSFFLRLTSKFNGDRISQTVYVSKAERKLRYINLGKIDLYLLRLLAERPVTVYKVIRNLGYSHSSAYEALQNYLKLGIIKRVSDEPLRSGGPVRKPYTLSDTGLSLLYVLEKLGIEDCRVKRVRSRSH